MNEKDRWRLQDMLQEVEDIASFLSEGARDKKTLKAIVRSIEIMGEASRAVSSLLKEKYPHIAWQKITDMRNFVAHEYFRTDEELVWKVAAGEVPELGQQIRAILEKEI